ncbi:MAG: hypothetical protein NTZ43_10000 [Gemmatimonadetes bacterium]|nr:hypothetical protein [Gemmatimonadota bacterium]
MIASPESVIERLEQLERLFDHARCHAAHDALALGEIFEQADGILAEVRASGIEQTTGPGRDAVIEAAERARQSHGAMTHAIGIEVARVGRELAQLSKGSAAAVGYTSASRNSNTGLLSRSL